MPRETTLALIGLIALLAALWCAWQLWGRKAQQPVDSPTLEQVLNRVKEELRAARIDQYTEVLPPLASVDLELTVQLDSTQEGSFSAGVPWGASVAGTASRASSRTQKVSLSLRPPRGTTQTLGALDDLGLARAIRAIADGIVATEAEPPKLDLSEASIEVSFQIQQTESLGAGFELEPLAAEAKNTDASTATHKVTLKFAHAKPPSATTSPIGWDD